MKFILALAMGLALMVQSSLSFAACGDTNQNACKLWERFPSCNAGLVESSGKCVAEKNPPKVPVSVPNLATHNCGAYGQRPCLITERFPSCDPSLVERAGFCQYANGVAPSPKPTVTQSPAPVPTPPQNNFIGWLSFGNGDQLKIDQNHQLHYLVSGSREIQLVVYTYPPGILCGQEIQLADSALPDNLKGRLRVNRYANQLEQQGNVQDSRYPSGWNTNAWLPVLTITQTSPGLQDQPCSAPTQSAPPSPPAFSEQAKFGCLNIWHWVSASNQNLSVRPAACAAGASKSSWIIRGVLGQDVAATGYTDGDYLRLESNVSALRTAYIYIGNLGNPVSANAEFRSGDPHYSSSLGFGGWQGGN